MARTIPSSDLGKGLRALGSCLRQPLRGLRTLQRGLAQLYREDVERDSPIPTVELRDLVGWDTEVRLTDFQPRDGNVSLYELLVISALVQARAPKVLLEIGTFDGNTTLQMAGNAPEDARIFTLDLPPDPTAAADTLDPHDAPYITDTGKQEQRRYQRFAGGSKVTQLLGDSATFDFAAVQATGGAELAFIDGSHSYEYVRSDTRRVRELLADDAIVLWHDYCPAWPGVIRGLDELHRELPLQRIAGTTLVYWRG